MWWKQGIRKSGSYNYRQRRLSLTDSRFQRKFFLMFVGGSSLSGIIGFSVATYFIMQNYDIFIEFAYTHAPNFVSNLEFEKKWILVIIASAFVSMQILVGAICYKLLHSLIYPLRVMRKHITNLTKGDWSQPELRIREDGDYQDLVQAYNYFYRTLQRSSLQELNQLMNLEISKNAHRSQKIWNYLIDTKQEQLTGSSEEREKVHDSHLVS